MNILNLVLTCISLILSIISEIISIQSSRKVKKISKNSEMEITCITTETKFMERKTTNCINKWYIFQKNTWKIL